MEQNISSALIELKKDKERMEFYEKILELLIAAGYYRARLPSLSPFDKILGGLTWTLTGCFCEVDIEFKDEMNIYDKIKISEKIVNALKEVECGISLQPHQIQGLDTKTLYEVVKWAVKKLLETRDSRNEVNKSACKAFFAVPKRASLKQKRAVNKAKQAEMTGRDFKIANKFNLAPTEQLKVLFTVMEYSMNKEKGFQRQLLDLLKKKDIVKQTKSLERKNTLSLSSDEKEAVNKMISSSVEEATGTINTEALNQLFSENVDEIARELEHFKSEQKHSKVDKLTLLGNEKRRIQDKLAFTEEKTSEIGVKLAKIAKEQELQVSLAVEKEEEILEAEQTQLKNEKRLKKAEEKIKELAASTEVQTEIEAKIKEREDLKQSIKEFKTRCKEEQTKLEKELAHLEKQQNKLEEEENVATFKEIDSYYSKEFSTLTAKKKDLSEENKEITSLTRKIQLTPSRLEMVQYQKRFQELYDEIYKVSELNKKYITEFNNKTEIIQLFEQKQDAFTQIQGAYAALSSSSEKLNFVETLNDVSNSLQTSVKTVVDKNRALVSENEEMSGELKVLQSKESLYLKLVKEYNKAYLNAKKANY